MAISKDFLVTVALESGEKHPHTHIPMSIVLRWTLLHLAIITMKGQRGLDDEQYLSNSRVGGEEKMH